MRWSVVNETVRGRFTSFDCSPSNRAPLADRDLRGIETTFAGIAFEVHFNRGNKVTATEPRTELVDVAAVKSALETIVGTGPTFEIRALEATGSGDRWGTPVVRLV